MLGVNVERVRCPQAFEEPSVHPTIPGMETDGAVMAGSQTRAICEVE